MQDTWQVACILREKPEITFRFLSWYRRLGAEKITLFFDDPEDEAIQSLQSADNLECIKCTPDFWRSINISPEERFTKRQNAALKFAYNRSSSSWFLNVDSDELISSSFDISSFLSSQDEKIHYIRILPVERLLHDHEKLFYLRAPMQRETVVNVYGESYSLFGPRRKGMAGHSQGKSFTRSGLKIKKMRQHWPVLDGGNGLIVEPSEDLLLIHMAAEDFRDWYRKIEWRLSSSNFPPTLRKHIQLALESPRPRAALRGLYFDLYGADHVRLKKMSENGVLFQVEKSLFGYG